MKYYTRMRREYAAGEVILTEHGSPDGIYIIESGRVRVYKTVGTGAARREVPLGVLGRKAVFGEMAMLDERPRSASVRALEPTMCTVITRDMFEHQLTRIPPWLLNVIKILITRIRTANDTLRERVGDRLEDDTGGLVTARAEQTTRST
jgi:CRP-like cAMP-binding protein